jgi:hypothetical protein
MSTLSTTNLKNPSSASNNIVLATGGDTTITNNLTVSGTGSNSIAGTFQFNSGYGSVATAYGCRAWVNFNGTGTVAIRASGNVSSITDNGVGDYTVNFTTAMPDANYAVNISKGITATRRTIETYGIDGTGASVTPTTAAVRIACFDESTTTTIDMAGVSAAIFR